MSSFGGVGRAHLMPSASRVRVVNHWWNDRLTDRKLNVVVICNIAAETDCLVSRGDGHLCRRANTAFIPISERTAAPAWAKAMAVANLIPQAEPVINAT
jgi:hypothetical protein